MRRLERMKPATGLKPHLQVRPLIFTILANLSPFGDICYSDRAFISDTTSDLTVRYTFTHDCTVAFSFNLT